MNPSDSRTSRVPWPTVPSLSVTVTSMRCLAEQVLDGVLLGVDAEA